jgi:hypothetical protein
MEPVFTALAEWHEQDRSRGRLVSDAQRTSAQRGWRFVIRLNESQTRVFQPCPPDRMYGRPGNEGNRYPGPCHFGRVERYHVLNASEAGQLLNHPDHLASCDARASVTNAVHNSVTASSMAGAR